MTEQKFVYVDANYLKELEETAKKVDYYKGIIDGINMVAEHNIEPFDKDINVRSKDEPKLSEIPTSKCHYEPKTDCQWK